MGRRKEKDPGPGIYEIKYTVPLSYDDDGNFDTDTVTGFYESAEWAEDHAYSLADKGQRQITFVRPETETEKKERKAMSESENALTTFHQTTALADPDALNAAISQARAKAPAVGSGLPFLKMDRHDGGWSYGQEDIEVEKGSMWVINTYSLKHGLVCWTNPDVTNKKAEMIGETMVPFNEDAPLATDQSDQSDKGGKWKDQVSFDLMCVSGEDTEVMVAYSGSSFGACKSYKTLLEDIATRPSADHVFAVIVMGENHYENKKYGGKTFNPEFNVVDWADAENVMLSSGEEKPKTSREKKASPAETEPELETEPMPEQKATDPEAKSEGTEEAPTTRRRRRRGAE